MIRELIKKYRYSYNMVCLTAALIMAVNIFFPITLFVMALTIVTVIDFGLCVSSITLVRREGVKKKNFFGNAFAASFTAALFLCLFFENHDKFAGYPGKVFLVIFDYVLAMFTACSIVGYAATKHMPSFDKDFVMILGCSIDKRGGLLPLIRSRTDRAIKFAWQQEMATGKQAKYIPTGGQGKNEIMSEGSAMEMYLISHGAEDYEVIAEKKSANTWENMVFSKKIADDLKPGNKVVFVTTNYHVLRSWMLARRAGLDAEGLSSTTKWYFWPNGFIREFIGILSMFKIFNIIAVILCVLISFLV